MGKFSDFFKGGKATKAEVVVEGERLSAKFSVSMGCQNCVNRIRDNISEAKGVLGLDISLADKTVTVTYDSAKTDADSLAKAIRSLGYVVDLLN